MGPHNIYTVPFQTNDWRPSPFPPFLNGCVHWNYPAGILPLCWKRGRYLSFWFTGLKTKRNHVWIWWGLNWMKWPSGPLSCFPWGRGGLEYVLQLGIREENNIWWLKSRDINAYQIFICSLTISRPLAVRQDQWTMSRQWTLSGSDTGHTWPEACKKRHEMSCSFFSFLGDSGSHILR